jgi:Sec7-like guanine-nucleotide exchange factor
MQLEGHDVNMQVRISMTKRIDLDISLLAVNKELAYSSVYHEKIKLEWDLEYVGISSSPFQGNDPDGLVLKFKDDTTNSKLYEVTRAVFKEICDPLQFDKLLAYSWLYVQNIHK